MITYRILNAAGMLLQQTPEPEPTLPPMVPADPGTLLREMADEGPKVPSPLLTPTVALWTLILGAIVLVAITVFLMGGLSFAKAGSNDEKAANAVRGMGRPAAILLGIAMIGVLLAVVLAVVSLVNGG